MICIRTKDAHYIYYIQITSPVAIMMYSKLADFRPVDIVWSRCKPRPCGAGSTSRLRGSYGKVRVVARPFSIKTTNISRGLQSTRKVNAVRYQCHVHKQSPEKFCFRFEFRSKAIYHRLWSSQHLPAAADPPGTSPIEGLTGQSASSSPTSRTLIPIRFQALPAFVDITPSRHHTQP